MFDSKLERSLVYILSALAFGILLPASSASPAMAADDAPWSVTLKVGQATIDDDVEPGVLGWRVDDEDTATGIAIGYSFHRNFGIEAGYHRLGTYPGLPARCDEVCPATGQLELLVATFPEEVEFDGFSLSIIPKWPVTERFVLYGKLGVFDWRGDVTPLFSGQSVEDPSDTDLLAGLGARFDLSRSLGLQLEYEGTELFDGVNLGATFRF